MKKMFLAMTAIFAAVFALAETPVYFRSEGPDCYADGTVVRNGEIYALVWSRTNTDGALVSEFAMDATGRVIDAANHKVLARAPIAKDGGCPPNLYIISDSQESLASSGVFAVYLFDTRARAGEGADVTVGPDESGSFTCNGYEKVPGGKVSFSSGATVTRDKSGKGGFSGSSAVATTVPEGTPVPDIKAIYAEGGAAVVTVDDTVPSIQYALLAYENLDAEPVNLANGVNGKTDDSIFLSTSNPKYRFFKVVRSDLKGGNDQE